MIDFSFQNLEITFQWLVVMIAFPLSAIHFWREFLKWKKSEIISVQVIGYKFHKRKWYEGEGIGSPFTPIVRYNRNGKTIETAIKNLNILIPEGQFMKIRLGDAENKHLRMHFVHLILTFLSITALIGFMLGAVYGLYIFAALFFTAILSKISIALDDYRLIGNWQLAFNYIRYKRPENYKNMGRKYFQDIENKETIPYQEAMAHYYHQCHKQKWQYIVILIAILAFIGFTIIKPRL